MKTSFETVSLHYMVRLLGRTYSEVLDAALATGLKGRVKDGTRVWTREEVETIRRHLGGK